MLLLNCDTEALAVLNQELCEVGAFVRHASA
jgi:hypothetical protein